jgi:hypothetical protein
MNDTLLTDTFIDMLSSKMQRSSVFSITTATLDSLSSIANEKPFFNKGILVFVYTESMQFDQLKRVIRELQNNTECLVVYLNTNFKTYNYLSGKLDTSKTKEISFYKPPIWLIEAYLQRNSIKKFSVDSMSMFMYRMRGQWKYIDYYIREIDLRNESLITAQVISEVIPKYNRMNLDTILIHLILNTLSKKDFTTLYEFKYAYKFIMSELAKRIDDCVEYKLDYIKGVLSYRNLEEYAKQHEIPSYILKTYLEDLLTQVSLSYLYQWKSCIYKYRKKKDGFMQMILDTGR